MNKYSLLATICPIILSTFQPEGVFIEWKAEEILQVDGQNEQDWAVIGSSLSVGYKPDKGSDSDAPSKYEGKK